MVTLNDIKKVRQPVSFACVGEGTCIIRRIKIVYWLTGRSEGDAFFSDEVRDDGRKYLEDVKVPNEFKLYRGVPHGEFRFSSYFKEIADN